MKNTRFVVTAALAGALMLGGSPVAQAAEPESDPWLGADKALHFGVSAGLATGGYAVSAALLDARGHALILGGSFALGAGIAKELLDLTGSGDPSWKDLTWDVLGTASGLALAWSLDLALRGVSRGHPLFIAPQVSRESVTLGVVLRF